MRGRSLGGRPLGGTGHGFGVRRRRPGGDPGGGGVLGAASDFDGTNDHMERGGDFTGNTDGKLLTLSTFIRFNATPTTARRVIQSRGGTNGIFFGTGVSSEVEITAWNSANSLVLNVDGVDSLTTGQWYHIMASFDMSNAARRHLYVDDVDKLNVSTYVDDNIDFTQTNHYIASNEASGNLLNGCLSELYINYDEYIDLSIEANRRLFIDASVKPVDLGSDGSTPTGNAPIGYWNNPFGSFETNKGTGGNMTVTGALTECASSPSD